MGGGGGGEGCNGETAGPFEVGFCGACQRCRVVGGCGRWPPGGYGARARSFFLVYCCCGGGGGGGGAFKRRIREAIEIHCQAPTLNRDVGYELPAIYRDVLSRGILSVQFSFSPISVYLHLDVVFTLYIGT